jgi:phage tail-like protein
MRPLATFNFEVVIQLPGSSESKGPLCEAAFSECDGLEMSVSPKTITQGGHNNSQIHLAGPVSYGQLTLKRGMTRSLDLWDWFSQTTQPDGYGLRADAEVRLYPSSALPRTAAGSDDSAGAPDFTFILRRCLPVQMRAPTLSGSEGAVAIEEMQLVYERLELKRLSGTVSDDA